MKDEINLCNFCGKHLSENNIFIGKDTKLYCGGKHEKLNNNRTKIFNEYLDKKYIKQWKRWL